MAVTKRGIHRCIFTWFLVLIVFGSDIPFLSMPWTHIVQNQKRLSNYLPSILLRENILSRTNRVPLKIDQVDEEAVQYCISIFSSAYIHGVTKEYVAKRLEKKLDDFQWYDYSLHTRCYRLFTEYG